MARIEKFEDIKSYQIAFEICLKVHKLTKSKDFDYSLRDQIRRSAVSVISNIAEGFERQSNNEFKKFLFYSKGSVGELRAQLSLAFELELIREEEYKQLYKDCMEVSKLLGGFIRFLDK